MDVSGKYPANGYPEQKYDPVQAEARSGGDQVTNVSSVTSLPPPSGQVSGKCQQASPGSSPHHAPLDTSYHPHENHDRNYLTPPGQTPAGGHVTPEMRDIKPQPHHDQNIDNDKDLSESSIEGPNERNDDKVSSEYPGHIGGPDSGYQASSGASGYYHHSDLSHPSYGGYSTAGPFPLSSPLARPRSNKNKANSGRNHK